MKAVLHDLVFDDGVDDIGKARALGELVFAGFKVAASLEHNHAAHEDIWLIDHTLALQQIGYVADAEAARNIHHFVLGQRTGRLEALLSEEQCGTNRDRNYDQQREDGISNYNERMSHAPRTPIRNRHPLRFERHTRAARHWRLAGRRSVGVTARR